MTTEAVLAGLFPPNKEEIWIEDILWQPIPVHTKPVTEDYLLINQTPCPRFAEIFGTYMQESDYAKDIVAKVAELSPYLSKKSGMNISTLVDTFLFYDALHVENLQNKKLVWLPFLFPTKV